MSIASRLRNPKRPNQKAVTSVLPGPNRGFIPANGKGLFTAPAPKSRGGFGGVTRAKRAAKVPVAAPTLVVE